MECVALGRRAEQPKPGISCSVWLAAMLGLIATMWPGALHSQEAARSQESVFLPKIEVIATSPLSGSTARSKRAPNRSASTPASAPITRANEEPGIDRD